MDSKYLIDDIFYYFVWGEDSTKELVRLIEEGSKVKTVVIVGPEEYEAPAYFTSKEQYKFFQGYLAYHKIKLIHITSAVKSKVMNYRYYINTENDTLTWENFFAHQVLSGQISRDLTPYGHSDTLKKHFTSMNGRAHKWRCMFIDYMAKYNLIDKGYVSWHNTENWQYQYKFKYWSPKKMSFDRRWRYQTDGLLDILFPPDEFKTSVFSIISESNTECLFVTEKTFIPIFHKRPFLVYGHPYHNTYLKSKGYELFDEVIDYAFDSVDNDEKRADMMMQQVEKLCQYDMYELKEMCQKKVEHNFRHMIKGIIQKNQMHHLINELIDKDHDVLEHYRFLLNIGNSEYFQHYLEKNNIRI